MGQQTLTIGQRTADAVVGAMGSWRFILVQLAMMGFWVSANVSGALGRWDPYPFIFLNLALSMQAAFAASLVLIAQRRSDERARLLLESDYLADVDALRLLHGMAHRLRVSHDESLVPELQRHADLARDVED